MIKNFWNGLELYCMHRHDEPVRMTVREGSSHFYACPKYMRMDAEHPDGHADGEPACNNRLSFADATKLVETFAAAVEESYASGEMTDFTNFRFHYKHLEARVLYYDDDRIKLGVINNRAIHS